MNHVHASPRDPALTGQPPGGSRPYPIGLRLRIWIACLAGSVLASLGMIWVAGTIAPKDGSLDPVLLAVFPWAVAGLGVLIGVAMAMWLDLNIVGHLRGLDQALADRDVAALRGLPAASDWGELSDLTRGIQRLMERMERLEGEAEQARLARLAGQTTVERILAALERWGGEGPEQFPSAEGPLAGVAEVVNQRLQLERESRERSREAVLEVRAGIVRGLEEARETETQAERGFIEATSLLTSVRELQRLRGELEQAIAAAGAAGGPVAAEPQVEALERYRATAAEAIEELVAASTSSVERIASGLERVREIADQVRMLGNRATLVALDAAVGIGVEGGMTRRGERGAELRRLAGEVQAVTERTAELSREVDREVEAAIDRMRGIRARMGEKLEPAPAPVAEAPAGAAERGRAAPAARLEQAARLLDRVREMIQDAMQKGERLSATSERASSCAHGLVRRLEEEIPAIEALVVRLGPAGETAEPAGPAVEDEPKGGLRLLEPGDVTSEEDSPAGGAEEIR